MSDTHVNAYKLELADKEQELAVLEGEIARLKKTIKSREDADTEAPESEPRPPMDGNKMVDNPPEAQDESLDVKPASMLSNFGDDKAEDKKIEVKKR